MIIMLVSLCCVANKISTAYNKMPFLFLPGKYRSPGVTLIQATGKFKSVQYVLFWGSR